MQTEGIIHFTNDGLGEMVEQGLIQMSDVTKINKILLLPNSWNAKELTVDSQPISRCLIVFETRCDYVHRPFTLFRDRWTPSTIKINYTSLFSIFVRKSDQKS